MIDAKNNVISPAQCRAGRALVRMNQQNLAKAAEVSTKTVADFEREIERQLNVRTLRALRAALEAAGVEFIPENGGGEGVRFKKDRPQETDVI
ncbi:transcriptional regulator [Azospirillum brasilense]|uniref:transcriptional regulator n=1 Tax=Azospirillum argentinense TaxID=2970906 RepID=UPI0027DC1377|nr:transcriptional regulator [Azospirillum argentinense]MBK3798823.1 transcriptional regulator [Azospirillum argentinense]